MEARSQQANSNVTPSTVPAAQAATAGKMKLDIDLDETVALELTPEAKQKYRANREYVTRRANINGFKDDTDSDSVKEKKTKKQKQRELFAKKEGDFTTPVVILILLDIQDKLTEHVTKLAKTDAQQAAEFDETIAIINATIAIFAKSDTIMQDWFYAKPSYLAKLKQRALTKSAQSGKTVDMFQHLQQLVNLVDKVKLTLELVPLIRELGLLLFGMYWNDAANLIADGKLNLETDEPIREPDGHFPTVSIKDRSVCLAQYGFRLLDVTYNHFLVYKKLEAKCVACELENGVAKAVEPVLVKQVKAEKKSEDFSIKLEKSSIPNTTDIIVRINTEHFPGSSAATAKRALIAMFKNPLGALLSYRIAAPVDLRICEFAERLDIFDLSPEMKTLLAGTQAAALKVLSAYREKKSSWANFVVWTVTLGTQDNKNLGLVELAQKAIEETTEYKKIIAIMAQLRSDTLKNGSTHIAQDIERFMLVQINNIRNSQAATGPGIKFPEPKAICDARNPNTQILVFNVPDEHSVTAEAICKVFHSVVANKIGFALAQCQVQDEDQRIGYFANKIMEWGFTEVQQVEYAAFYERSESILIDYIDPTKLSYVNLARLFDRGTLPRFMESRLEKTHAVAADGLLKVLTDPNIELTTKILETIATYERVKDKFSTTLGPALKKFLLEYMSWLTPCIPQDNVPVAVLVPRSTSDVRLLKK